MPQFPFVDPISPLDRPETTLDNKVPAKKCTYYVRDSQSHALKNLAWGLEQSIKGKYRIDQTSLIQALIEMGLDMAYGRNPVALAQKPADALREYIMAEIKTKGT